MSKTPVMIAIVLALLLGVASIFLLKTPHTAQSTTPIAWLAGLDASQLRSFAVHPAKGGTVTIAREPATGEWLMSPEVGPAWPVGVERLRPFLRLMNEAGSLPNEPGGMVPSDATALVFTLVDGQTRTMQIGGSPLGGKVIASIQDGLMLRVVMAEDGLRKLVQRESLLAWRDPRAVPRSGVEPSRVRLETPRGRVRMSRVLGRWALTLPIQCPANEDAMRALTRQIATLRGDRLLDDVNPADAIIGADNPTTYICFESDLRLAAGDRVDRRMLVEEVRVGKPADMGGKSLYATVGARLVDPSTNAETPLWGPIVLTISKENLDALVADPGAYASRRAVPFPGADATGVTLVHDREPMATVAGEMPSASSAELKAFKQSIRGWEVTDSSGGARTLEGADAAGIAGLVRALCEIDAASVGAETPVGATSIARCMVLGVGSTGSESVRVGVASVDGVAALVVTSGRIFRVYRGDWVEGLVAWIRTQAKPEG